MYDTKYFKMTNLSSYLPTDNMSEGDKLKMKIASDIKSRMNECNMAMTKLCELTGIDKSYISRILNCQVNLTIEMIAKIYHPLGGEMSFHLDERDRAQEVIEVNTVKDDNLMMCA